MRAEWTFVERKCRKGNSFWDARLLADFYGHWAIWNDMRQKYIFTYLTNSPIQPMFRGRIESCDFRWHGPTVYAEHRLPRPTRFTLPGENLAPSPPSPIPTISPCARIAPYLVLEWSLQEKRLLWPSLSRLPLPVRLLWQGRVERRNRMGLWVNTRRRVWEKLKFNEWI